MRRILSICIAIALVLVLTVQAFAADNKEEYVEIIHFEDGSYITVELDVIDTRTAYTKRATKTYTYRGSDNSVHWKAELIGSFQYDGETANCMSSICNVTIINTNWYVISKSATKNDNKAKASLKMGYRTLGITTSTKSVSIQIACDVNGNIS